eukprot:4016323-Amphidinium_carterae.1
MHCRLCLTKPPQELQTIGRWVAFDPLLPHSVKATPGTVSVVLYSARRDVRQEDMALMKELGFPGWEADTTEVEEVSSSTTGDDAQDFTTAPTRNESRAQTSITFAPASLPRTTTDRGAPVEISPTLPFTGGEGIAMHQERRNIVFDPDIEGECVFQSMLWLAGFGTSWAHCTWARLLVARMWSALDATPLQHSLLTLLSAHPDTINGYWTNPFRVRRWGCLIDIILLAIAWDTGVRILCNGQTLAEIRPRRCIPCDCDLACLGFNGRHYWVQSNGLPTLCASIYVPDLTEEGVEPNPGPPKHGKAEAGEAAAARQPPSGKATNKRKSTMVKQLLQLRVDFTPHQLRTLVHIDGACERLEAATSDQQRKDVLSALYQKSGFRKESAHPEAADDLPAVTVQISEDLEVGFQVKPSLLTTPADFDGIEKAALQNPQVRAKILKLLQDLVHPVSEAASIGASDRTLVNDAVIVRIDADYIAGRCWIAGDLMAVLSLSGGGGVFFNPPLATQLLYRVSWVEGEPAALFKAHQTSNQFAGVVMSKDRYGIRTRVADALEAGKDEWEVKGIPLRLTEKAVIDILTALGINGSQVHRELNGWRLTTWDRYPVPPPLALNAEQSKHKINTGTDTFVVWFKRLGGRQRSGARSTRPRSASRRASRSRTRAKPKPGQGESEGDELGDKHFEGITQETKALRSGHKKMKPASEVDIASMAERMLEMQLLMAKMAKQ